MPGTALPVLLFRRRAVVWAAVLLLSCCLGVRLNADEGAKPIPPAGTAKSDPFRSEDLTIPADDHQLAGTLYLPPPGPPAPAVVFVHGAGPAARPQHGQLGSRKRDCELKPAPCGWPPGSAVRGD